MGEREQKYLRNKGLAAVLEHGSALIDARLAPASPANDGKQTLYRGHPIFIAQHATATCCRGCRTGGHPPKFDERYPGRRRLYVSDPFGNRLEFQQIMNDER